MFTFHCPNCSATVKAPEDRAGSRAKCPHCGSAVTVPSQRGTHIAYGVDLVSDEPDEVQPVRAKASRAAAREPADEWEDQPVRGRRQGKRGGFPLWILVVGISAVVMVVGCAGFAFFVWLGSGGGYAPGE